MFVPRTEIKRLAADGALDLDGSSGTGEGVMQVFHNPRTTTRKRSNAHPRSDLTFRRASVAGRRVPAVLLGGAFKQSVTFHLAVACFTDNATSFVRF